MRKTFFHFFSISFALLFLFNLHTLAQAPAIQWKKCYGGTNADVGYCLLQTDSGQYLFAGHTSSTDGYLSANHGMGDGWVVKLNDSIIAWEKVYGGSSIDEIKDVIPYNGAENEYVAVGYTYSNDGDVTGNHGMSDGWIVFLDNMGKIIQQKCLGGSNLDKINAIAPTKDGGYIAAGLATSNDGDVTGVHDSTYGDMWVVKLNSTGNIVWQKCLGGSFNDEAYSVQQTYDGGYIVAGYTNSSDGDVTGFHGGGADGWVVRLSSTGSMLWQSTYGSTGTDYANAIMQTNDSGFIFVGSASANDGDVSGVHGVGSKLASDIWVVKISARGVPEWQKCYGGTNIEGSNYHIERTFDNGYLIGGQAASFDGDVTGCKSSIGNYWVVKIDDTGKLQWNKCMGNTDLQAAEWCIQTKDSGYAIVGQTTSGGGDVTGSLGSYDAWFIKLGKDSLIKTAVQNTVITDSRIKVYPTPGKGLLHIDMPEGFERANINLYNTTGQKINVKESGALMRVLNTSNVPAGMYVIEIVNKGKRYSYRVIINNR